jgi:hypothetical protein
MATDLHMVGLQISLSIGAPGLVVHVRNSFQDQMLSDLSSVFFNTSEFAQTCVYRHYQIDRSEYKMVNYPYLLDDPSIDGGLSNLDILVSQPRIQISKHRFGIYPTTRDSVTVDGIVYQVSNIVDDGVGVVTLYLQRFGNSYD